MKYLLIIIGILLFISCGIPEAAKKSQEITEDLSVAFNHNNIQTAVHRGTKEEDNRLTITFGAYNLADKCYKDLENLAKQVQARLLNRNPGLKEMYLIEVKFINKENEEELQNAMTYQFGNDLKRATH